MSGYDPNFIPGINVPLPTFSIGLAEEILKNDKIPDGLLPYQNYSVVMNASERTACVVASNIDQSKIKKTSRGDWNLDPRIGRDDQLDNDYYKNNEWDRGHLAMREVMGWGDTAGEAQTGSNDTMFYTNSSLQHENYNQDEWLELENWVHDLELDADGHLNVFIGPIYGRSPRSLKPSGRDVARIPCAFFKIVCFKDKGTSKLGVRAFILVQDGEYMHSNYAAGGDANQLMQGEGPGEFITNGKTGKRYFNHQNYQVSIAEIEQLTGLVFHPDIAKANPIYFGESAQASSLGVRVFPEVVDVNGSADIVNTDVQREPVADEDYPVFIAAAMVKPKSGGQEWVSLFNLSGESVTVDGWKLVDKSNHAEPLSGIIASGESKVFSAFTKVKLADAGGVIKVVDAQGRRVDRVSYTKDRAKVAGTPVVFLRSL